MKRGKVVGFSEWGAQYCGVKASNFGLLSQSNRGLGERSHVMRVWLGRRCALNDRIMGANREAGAGAGCEVLQAEGADVNANALGRDFRFGRGIRVHCRFAFRSAGIEPAGLSDCEYNLHQLMVLHETYSRISYSTNTIARSVTWSSIVKYVQISPNMWALFAHVLQYLHVAQST